MENQNQNTQPGVGGDSGLSPPSEGVHEPPSGALSGLSLDDPQGAQQPFTSQVQLKRPGLSFMRFARRLDVALLFLLMIGILAAFFLTNRNSDNEKSAHVPAGKYATIEIPLGEFVTGKDLALTGAPNVTINGSLLLTSGLSITPSLQPTGARAGQIYYDRNTQQLAYFNGEVFVFLTGAPVATGVQSLGGATGQLTLGDGLTITNNQLSSTAAGGVLSIQGENGDVVFTAGPGITINGTNFSNTGVVSIAAGSPNVTVSNDEQGNITIAVEEPILGTGTVTSSGGTAGTVPVFTAAQNIEDSIITQSGLTVTISGDLSVVTGGLSLSNALTVSNGGTGATSLAANGVLVGQGTSAITSVATGTPGLCLLSSAGVPTWAACPSASGVNSLNGLTGALNIANAGAAGSTITIDDASTTAKGIASFNSTNFTASGGAINTIQNINSGATPTFAGVNTNSVTPNAALTVGVSAQTALLQGSTTTITSNGVGNNIILNSAGTIELQDNTNVTGAITATGDLAVNGGDITSSGTLNITPGGTLTIGAATQTLTLQGGAATSFRASSGASTTIVSFASPTANTTLNFPALAAGTYTICTSSGNCSGAAATLQSAYDNSTSPEIVLDATRGALTLRDAAAPLGANLLEVQNDGGSVTYFGVSSSGVAVTGTATTSGNVNTLGGSLQTNSITRIDNAGNLVNIASVTASGNATFQGGGLTLGTNAQAGSVVMNDGSSNTGTLQVAALGQNTVYILPDAGGPTATLCLTTGNCAGTGGGVTTSAGTTNTVPKFTGAQAIGDSNITDNGTTVTIGSALAVSGNSTFTGDLGLNGGDLTSTGALNITPGGALALGATTQTALLQGSTTTITSNGVGNDIVLTSADQIRLTGFDCTVFSNGGVLTTDASGNLACAHDDGGGSTPTFQSVYDNSTPAAFTLNGTNDGLIVSDNATPIGSSLFRVQNNAGSTAYLDVTTAGIGVSGVLNISGNTTLAGDVAVNGGDITSTGALNITPAGTLIIGAVGEQLVLQGDAGTELSATDGSNTTTVVFQTPTADVTYRIPTAAAGTYDLCTTAGNCVGTGGGVSTSGGTTNTIALFSGSQTIGDSIITQSGTTINIAGSLTLANALGVGQGGTGLTATPSNGQLLIGNGTGYTLGTLANNGGVTVSNGAGSIGLAVNYGAVSGTAVQGDTTLVCASGTGNLSGGGNTITLGSGGTCNSLSTVNNPTFTTSVTTPLIQNAGLTLAATGANSLLLQTNGNTRLTIDSSGNMAATGNLSLQGGGATLGTTSQTGSLALHDGNGQTTTFQAGNSTGNLTFILPTNAGVANQCLKQSGTGNQLVWQDCDGGAGGSSATLQTVYNNSVDPEIILNSSVGGLTVRDNGTPISGNLLEVQNNAGDTDYFTISTTGAAVTGSFTATGNINTSGTIQTGGTTRIDASGNLTNIGTVSAGTYNGQTISNAASLTGTLAVAGNTTLTGNLALNGGNLTSTGALNVTPGGTLTVGVTGQQLILQGNANTQLTATGGGFTTTIGFTGTPTGAVTYNLDRAATSGTYTICTTVGNCAGSGGGVTTSGGTTGALAKFTGSQTLGDSLLSESGATVTVNGNLNLTTGNQFQVNGTQISSANLSNDSNLAKLGASQTFTGNTVAFQNGTNSTNAFNVQNAGGNRILTVDSSNGQVVLGVGSVLDGKLVFSNVSNNNTVTILPGTPTANRTLTLPDASGIICTNSGNCAGAGATLQTSYNFSVGGTTPKIKVNNTLLGVDIQDADTTIAANLFNVRSSNSGGLGTVMFGVGSEGDVTMQNASNSTTAFRLLTQGGTSVLTGDTQNGLITLGQASTLNGRLVFSNATNANTVTLIADTATGARTVTLPDETGTVCLRNSANCGFALSSGSGNYIQNGTSLQTGNFYIQSASASSVGGIIRGASAQTSSLLQMLDGTTGFTVAQFTNNGYLQLGSDSIPRSGQIILHDNTISNSNTISLVVPSSIGASHTITIPAETGTVCLQSSSNCGFAASSGSGNYIQNQNASAQTANYWVSGTGRADTSMMAPTFDSASGVLGVGTTNASAVTIGRTDSNNLTTINGQFLNRPVADTTITARIQNAAATAVFNVDTTSPNLISNNSFETNGASGWSAHGGASAPAQTILAHYDNDGSLQVDATAANHGARFNYALTASTQYSLSMFVRAASADFSTLQIGYSADGSTDTSCATGQTAEAGKWLRITCTFTTGAVSGTRYVYIKQTDATTRTFYIDAVQLEAAAAPTPYRNGKISLGNSVMINGGPLDAVASTAALQVNALANGSGVKIRGSGENNIFTTMLDVRTYDDTQSLFHITETTRATNVQGGSGVLGTAALNVSTIDTAAQALRVTGIASATGPLTVLRAGATPGVAADILQFQDSTGLVHGAFNAIGSVLTLGRVASSGTVSQGVLRLSDGTTSNYTASVQTAAALTGNAIFELPGGVSGTYEICTTASVCSGYASSAGTNYIQNQNSSAQTTANFWISGTGRADTALQAPAIRATANGTTAIQFQNAAGSATALSIDTSNNRVSIGNTGTAFAPQQALDVIGNFQLRDAATATKAYRFRTSGSSLDLESAGAALYVSNWTGADFTGTQRNYLVLESSSHTAQAIGSWQFRTAAGGTTRHTIDGTTGASISFNDNGEATNFTIQGDTAANLFFAQGSTDRIGIGTGTPGARLDVMGATTGDAFNVSNSTSTGSIATFKDNATTVATIANGGATTFQNSTNSTSAFRVLNSTGGSLLNLDAANSTASILGVNSGDVSAWTTDTGDPIGGSGTPQTRYGATTVTANGYIYVIGGISGSSAQDTVWYAKLNVDGSVSNWTQTTNLPATRARHASMVANGYVYVIGGNQTAAGSPQSTVYYAQLNSDGTIGSWNTASPIGGGAPVARIASHVTTFNGYLYVIGGNNGTSDQSSTYYVRINADGSLGTWTIDGDSLPEARSYGTSMIANGYVYVMGGYDSGTPSDVVYYSPLSKSGGVGTWQTTTSMFDERIEASTAVVNGYVYVLGGNLGTYQNTVFYAKVNSDGTIGTWSSDTDLLPDDRAAAGTAVVNGYLYVLGGYDGSSASTVYYASTSRVQIGASLDLVGLQDQNMADGGDSSTGSLGGSVTAGNGTFVGSLQVVGQSQFSGSMSVERDFNVAGLVVLKNSVNSTTAFQVMNATAVPMFVIDTTNSYIYAGNPTADSTGALLVLDTKSGSGDPTHPAGLEGGGMYYNANGDVMRCYEDSTWHDCSGGTLGYAQVTANQTGLTSAAADLTGLSVTVTVPANHRIRITAQIAMSGNTVNDAAAVRIHESTTQLQECHNRVTVANSGDAIYCTVVLTPSAGSHTYNLKGVIANGGGGTGILVASSTKPASILVEDIGK